MKVMVVCPLELLGLEQCVGEIDQEPYCHEGRERIVEDHVILLKSVAGVGVTDRQGEEAEPKGQQNHVKHAKLLATGVLPSAIACADEGLR